MILHVLNGDATRIPLEQAGLPGQLLVHVDVLHDGPAPAGLDEEAWRRVRAEHLAGDAYPADDIVQSWRDADATLERYATYDEVVFWFEHDLFDQLLLIRHLDWLSRVSDISRFRLICIGEFPGHSRFAGLGELNPRELASLFPERRPIAPGQVALGSTLWAAFTAPDPRPFASLVLDGTLRRSRLRPGRSAVTSRIFQPRRTDSRAASGRSCRRQREARAPRTRSSPHAATWRSAVTWGT